MTDQAPDAAQSAEYMKRYLAERETADDDDDNGDE